MATKKQMIIRFLIILFTVTAIYITLQGQDIRIRVDNDKTIFYIFERGRWLISGVEYNKLYNGTSLVRRNVSGIYIETFNTTDNFTIIRYTPYRDGAKIIDTYFFEGNTQSKERFPVYHTIQILNGKGLIYEYSVTNLQYDGSTRDATSPERFGRNMKVEWQKGDYWAKVYQSGILKVRYRITDINQTYTTRLYDPTTEISTCSVLDQAGETYLLTTDIIDSDAEICMSIEVDNITLNCQGYIIDGTSTFATTAFQAYSVSNITVENCLFTDWHDCIKYIESHNGLIINNSLDNCKAFGYGEWAGTGIDIDDYDNVTITNCSLENGFWGIYNDYSDNLTIKDSRFINNSYGIYFYDDTGENIPLNVYNNFFNNTENVYFEEYFTPELSNIFYNTTQQSGTRIYSLGTNIGGNYWTNSTGNGYSDTCIDADGDGFCDLSLNLTNMVSCSGATCGNNTDYLPLSKFYENPNGNISNCYTLDKAGATYYLTADIIDSEGIWYDYWGYYGCMDIQADNITLDCQGHLIDGDGVQFESKAIFNSEFDNLVFKNCIISDWTANAFDMPSADAFNITIKNNSITNCHRGINIDADFSLIEGNIFEDNDEYGIFEYSDNTTIINNTIRNNNYGIYLDIQVDYNNISDNIIMDNTVAGMLISSDSDNMIYNNLFNNSVNIQIDADINYFNTTQQSGTRIYSNGNYIGGNYWTNSTSNGYSDTCTDVDTDGFCDEPYTLAENNIDYLPYSDEYSVGEPDINYTFGPDATTKLMWDVNSTGAYCGPDYTSYWVEPENQNSTHGIFYVCNNGTASGNLKGKLSGIQNTGWIIMFSNSSSTSDAINMTTTYQTINSTFAENTCSYVWGFANCTTINQNPGVNIEFDIA